MATSCGVAATITIVPREGSMTRRLFTPRNNLILPLPAAELKQSFPATSAAAAHRLVVLCQTNQTSNNGGHTPTSTATTKPIKRRSGNYPPPVWDYNSIQSIRSSGFGGTKYKERIDVLKMRVKVMLINEEMEPLAQLELIDILQRLGVAYHLKDEFGRILENVYNRINNTCEFDDHKEELLYAKALIFRIFRQHGYKISSGMFNAFTDENNNLMPYVSRDTKGLLYLYEASFYSFEDEFNLNLMREQTRKQLEENLDQENIDQNLVLFVEHALDIPLHRRMPRIEARWFIDMFEKLPNKDPILLEFAKLDFNYVQAIYQDEVKHASRWWSSLRLTEKLSFLRERVMRNFFWGVGLCFEPQYSYCRRIVTQVFSLLMIIDDIYDVHGTLDELQLFTIFIERWDMNEVKTLPDYMQICFMALDNFVNEVDSNFYKNNGFHIVSYLRKAWTDQCRSYWKEAQWYYNEYTPTLEEYSDNAWISIGGPLTLVHVFFFFTVNSSTTAEPLDCIHSKYQDIIRYSSVVSRFANDLKSSTEELKRGDVAKAMQCYISETGAREEEARGHVMFLIDETWKAMNGERERSRAPFSDAFMEIAMNLARTAHCFYRNGDGYNNPIDEFIQQISSVVVDPFPLLDWQNVEYPNKWV